MDKNLAVVLLGLLVLGLIGCGSSVPSMLADRCRPGSDYYAGPSFCDFRSGKVSTW